MAALIGIGGALGNGGVGLIGAVGSTAAAALGVGSSAWRSA